MSIGQPEKYVEVSTRRALDDYGSGLAELSRNVGGRNCMLMKVARPAKRAGISCERFVSDVIEAGGEPRLEAYAVRRAWQRCRAVPISSEDFCKTPCLPRKIVVSPWTRAPSKSECSFVRQHIAYGEKWLNYERKASGAGSDLTAFGLLRHCSQVEFEDTCFGQAAAEIRTQAAWACVAGVSGGGVWFAGERYDARKAESVDSAERLIEKWRKGCPVPTLVSVNPHTGQGVVLDKDRGMPLSLSYRCNDTVASWCFTLVEFDAMPLGLQSLFWLGVLAKGALRVVSLVFSAGRSIHGIVVVPKTSAGAMGSRMNYKAAWGVAGLKGISSWGPLSRILCSDEDALYRADMCASTVLTARLAGHVRVDWDKYKKGAGPQPSLQRLLWLGKPPVSIL